MSSSEDGDADFGGTVMKTKKLLSIFISYRWNETKDDVRSIANALKSTNKYDVWIDTEEMYGDKNERMEEGIRRADVVVIFFSDDYQKSRDCRKEAESADRNGKPIVFVKMQRPKCEISAWFAPIIGSTIFVDFYKFKNPVEEIEKHIERITSSNDNDSLHGLNLNSKQLNKNRRRFVTIKVPKFAKYQKRSDELNICEAIKKLCLISEFDKEGALVICGGGGTGKTTLISQLTHNHSDFLRDECGVNVVIWLNCFKWTGDGFDEDELIKTLIDLTEKAADYSGGFGTLKEVCEFYEREHERVLIVVDDVFNAMILETLREHCPSFSCVAVTRDVDQLTSARHGLVNEIYRLHELDEEEIIAMFENAYRLKDRLKRDQLVTLAKQCSGLPIVVSLIAARFQDCETTRDFNAEFELVLDEVKVKDMKITGPYGTVSKLFEFSIEQLDEQFRKMYYAFLLFDPAEPVDVEDLALLWNCSNPHRALVRCRQIAKKSLARPAVVSSSGTNNMRQGDFFLVHQILHEAAVDNATKTHHLASSLPDLREEIIVRFSERNDLKNGAELLAKTVLNQRRHLLETIFRHVSPHFLSEICKIQLPDLIENGQNFLHFLYNATWPDNGPATLIGANHSFRILRQLFDRLLKFNATKPKNQRVNVVGLLSAPDSTGNCLLLQLFTDVTRTKAHKFDRRKLADFVSPIDGAYKKYKQLEWFREAQESETETTAKTSELFMAAGRGDLDIVAKLAEQSPSLVLLRNSMDETPMIAAALMGHYDVVKFLYNLNPSDEHVNAADLRGKTAFLVACHYGQLEIVKFLYENNKNSLLLRFYDKKKRTPLILAAMNGALDVVEFFYNEDETLIRDAERAGKTALIMASRFGHIDVVRFLIENCHLNHDDEKDSNGMTPLMYAAVNGRLEIADFLCNNKDNKAKLLPINVNQRDSHGTTALMHAARHGHVDLVALLWQRDNNEAIEGRQNDGKTALILAAERNELEVVKFLCEKSSSNIEARFYADKTGHTALMAAAKQGLLDMVTLLCSWTNQQQRSRIAIGVKLRNKTGRDALKFAAEFQHAEVEHFLRSNFYTENNSDNNST